MADIDEDPPTNNDEDHDPTEDAQDFLLLASSISKSSHHIPKRGEKDFESHGTKHQDGILEASRQAMHDVLDYTRVHTPRGHTRAFYYGKEVMEGNEVGRQWRQGLTDDHVVLLESSKGPHFKTMGQPTLGTSSSNLWLLPEEALYLVERGTLDLWWPSRSSFKGFLYEELNENENETEIQGQNDPDEDEGVPMSLQACYAMLLGDDSEKGKVSLDRYSVYANLKRTGYVVMRARGQNSQVDSPGNDQVGCAPVESPSIFNWLFGRIFAEEEVKHSSYGPLVKPGMYRSYHAIYRQIAIIPRHTPLPTIPAHLIQEPENPFRVVYELWQATKINTFAKTSPGPPDFRVAITDSRSSSLPTLKQMTSMLESTPWNPPPPEFKAPGKMYQRLRHGWRNVLLAVVDQGIISYLRLSETAFGEEKLFERFDGQGAKRGGGASRGGGGRGRGRGRGRARGGHK